MHCNGVSGQSRTLDRPASFIWLVIPGENEMSKAASLEYTDRFVSRHIGPNEAEVRDMLQTIGYDSLDSFIDTVIPAGIRFREALKLPAAASEFEMLREIRETASHTHVYSYL